MAELNPTLFSVRTGDKALSKVAAKFILANDTSHFHFFNNVYFVLVHKRYTLSAELLKNKIIKERI